MSVTGMLNADGLCLGFPGAEGIVKDVNLTITPGMRLLICGATGSGKTTLLNALSGIIPRLVPNPGYQGQVTLDGRALGAYGGDALFSAVGVVSQNVEDQLWDLCTEDIIAFPMENRAVPRAEIRTRLRTLMEQLELTPLAGRRVLTLSGGERRMVAIAAALAARPRVLVLDEPTTGLDPAARARLCRALIRAQDAVQATVIADQDAASLADAVTHIALLHDGHLAAPQPKAAAIADTQAWRDARLLPPTGSHRARTERPTGSAVLNVAGLTTRLTRPSGEPVLSDLSFSLGAGEVVALLGRNGAGKTTLFRSVLGLAPITAGTITIGGQDVGTWTTAKRARQIAYIPQNMRQILFNMTVMEEVVFAMTAKNVPPNDAQKSTASQVLARYGLAGQEAANPFALSARQQGQLGLACAEAAGALVTIIDEPLIARDMAGRALLEGFLHRATTDGRAVMLISHDLELADDVADRSLIVADGHVAFAGPVAQGWTSAPFTALGWPAPYGDLS